VLEGTQKKPLRTQRKPLSPREAEILEMISRGLTNPQIAKRLDLTVHAVKFHLASVYRKLGVANRTEAAVALLESKSFDAKGS
jgi:DNA-binding NarL/FixJ family response regulator